VTVKVCAKRSVRGKLRRFVGGFWAESSESPDGLVRVYARAAELARVKPAKYGRDLLEVKLSMAAISN
jgi:hypothetical protein